MPIEKTAAKLGISVRTIRNGLQRGTFPIKPRRYGSKLLWREEDVDAYIGDPEERGAIREGAAALDLSEEQAIVHLGEGTFDINLNDVAFWCNIPAKVRNYYIGGYQVIKKWLSYREQPLLGRPLTPDEVEEFTHMARIIILEPALKANYQAVKASAYAWPGLSVIPVG